jgi:hypothetical protein
LSSAPSVWCARKEGRKEADHALVFVTLDALGRLQRWLRRLQGRNGLYIERREKKKKKKIASFVVCRSRCVGWGWVSGIRERSKSNPPGRDCATYAGSFFGFDGHVGCVRRLDWRWVHVYVGPVQSNRVDRLRRGVQWAVLGVAGRK